MNYRLWRFILVGSRWIGCGNVCCRLNLLGVSAGLDAEEPADEMCTLSSAWIGLFMEDVVRRFAGSISLFSRTSSTSVKSVPVDDGATGEGSTMLSGALGDGGARWAAFSLGLILSAASAKADGGRAEHRDSHGNHGTWKECWPRRIRLVGEGREG